MRWLLIVSLVIFNGFALLQAFSYFLTTFSDLPLQSSSLPSCVPEALAKALGHAKHEGGEAMRDYLFKGVTWLVAAVLVNFMVAALTIFKGRS